MLDPGQEVQKQIGNKQQLLRFAESHGILLHRRVQLHQGIKGQGLQARCLEQLIFSYYSMDFLYCVVRSCIPVMIRIAQ
ncbi:hypothetical protein D3C75_875430 [compost metagenome]